MRKEKSLKRKSVPKKEKWKKIIKRYQKIRKFVIPIEILCLLFMLGGVSVRQKEEITGKSEYIIVQELDIPKELAVQIEKNKKKSFHLTYADSGMLYIAMGYGAKEKAGYRAEISKIYETENRIHVQSSLEGPKKGEENEKKKEETRYPYIVVCLQDSGKEIVFE